jgi:ATP-dependent RNA helicase RhlE
MLEERPFLKDIEKLIQTKIPVVEDHPFGFKMEDAAEPSLKKQGGGGRGGNRNSRPSGGKPKSNSSGGNRNKSRSRNSN